MHSVSGVHIVDLKVSLGRSHDLGMLAGGLLARGDDDVPVFSADGDDGKGEFPFTFPAFQGQVDRFLGWWRSALEKGKNGVAQADNRAVLKGAEFDFSSVDGGFVTAISVGECDGSIGTLVEFCVDAGKTSTLEWNVALEVTPHCSGKIEKGDRFASSAAREEEKMRRGQLDNLSS
jgi:hypothetical protein